MIPKIIHYCWLSCDPYPAKIKKCIDSWKQIFPDYKFVLWDINSSEINTVPWVKQAFKVKKYAFAADYIRLYALYKYGGIYLDSDVEVLKSFDDLLSLPYFIGCDSQNKIEAAIIGAYPNTKWIYDCLSYYENRNFEREDETFDITTLPIIMEEMVRMKYQIKLLESYNSEFYNDKTVCLFPFDFFCSKRHDTGKIVITERTYSIHHFAMSWQSKDRRMLTYIKRCLIKLFGEKGIYKVERIFYLDKLK